MLPLLIPALLHRISVMDGWMFIIPHTELSAPCPICMEILGCRDSKRVAGVTNGLSTRCSPGFVNV